MNKIIFLNIALWLFLTPVSGQDRLDDAVRQVATPDTIYIYETVTMYDTIVIHDTIRIKKATDSLELHEETDAASFSAPPTATFSENDIILHENNKRKNVKTMKFNTTKFLGVIIATAQSMSGLLAQEATTETELKRFPAQLSIFYPMTTQGDQTVNYHYNFSFNLFAGRVGAVTGIEFGTLSNRVEREVNGVQFSGLVNITRNVTGVQFAGIINASKNVTGIQQAGWGNIAGNVSGVQLGEIANIAERVKGLQFGGIANATKEMSGLQFGGIFNLNERNEGLQFAGITNVTNESKGFQFAGITNVSNEVSGASFGGVFNRTGTLRGFQFGIVNVTDTIEKGVSLAIVNIVKKGFYREWSLTFADYLNVGLNYKMGIQRFYTTFTVGANFIEDKLWVAGIGFGNRTALGRRIDFQPEIVSYNYYPSDFKNVRNTWSTHLKLGFIYKLNDRLGIVVAPSIYQFNTDMDENLDYYKISPIEPLYKHEKGSSLNSIGVGISVGLILK